MLRHIQGILVTAISISFINLLDLIDPKKCFALIRLIRWGETINCPKCSSHHVIKRGFDDTQPEFIDPNPAHAATITYDITVNNLDGSLSGDEFTGDFSFDDATLTGSGSEFLSVSDLSFDFLETIYTVRDDNSSLGAKAEFLDGEFLGLSYSTDIQFSFVPGFFSLSDSFFAYDLSAGDNGTGDVIYTVRDNPNPGIIPEPATIFGLLTTVILGSGLKIRKNKCSRLN
ncbi:conserved hypothetical protein [Hyella patelloides LEGE 07179]|uniref:PEP-CTERM sorting domain-containing protein n=1 Tax=Hyella patelloides LEGE 07179 TaxID=945734 RepID=A0A563W1T5_9CYAN|nr:PEP-CTERM sorting domain-containing protein [Hyella patelloides]VEP17674.1 conserved hypothetical protein [Hyella patelloides LEGE 07179]